jgi:hypothetical protein
MKDGLEKRFLPLFEDPCFKIATYLDPFFNETAFKPFSQDRSEINSIIRSLVRAEMGNKEDQSVALSPVAIPARKRINFELYEPIEEYSYDEPKSDLIETTIRDYLRSAARTDLPALEFWKKEERSFPYLAKIAKTYLGIQASSAAVERMFSISGHIFSLKRRRLGEVMFSDLVYLKLNENKL